MKRIPSPNSIEALNQMKMEIANEFDASLTNEEKTDGTTLSNLIHRSEKKAADIDKDTFYPFV